MKEAMMDIEWRTVQFFLDDDGVAEVAIDHDSHTKARCTCLTFTRTARCAHVKYVKAAQKENDGHYQIEIPMDVSDEEAILAMTNHDTFREFVLKHGKVLTL